MSGLVKDNIFGSSGIIAEAAGGLSWQPVVTASTVSVEAAKGYFINTTSNACTITLPSSATAGDQIILIDYARTWGTNAITIDSNGLNFQGSDDTYIVDYDTAGQSLNLVYSDATIGWTPSSDIVNAFDHGAPPTQKGIFAFGNSGSVTNISNLVSSSGVVATDTTGVGTARSELGACSYGGDKAIFGYGTTSSTVEVSMTNLVSNSGVIGSDVTGVGTARNALAACGYGLDKGIFAYGLDGIRLSMSNLVSSSGVVASDTTGVGTARQNLGAATYGLDKGIFGYGADRTNITNLVNSSGVIGSDVTGVGTARTALAAASYGGDKAIFGYGTVVGGGNVSITNLVSNSGVVATDTAGVGSGRGGVSATNYGGDKAIFGFGDTPSAASTTNLVSNTGVVSSDVTGVGTARGFPAAAGFSYAA
jgi:hypothetical protein